MRTNVTPVNEKGNCSSILPNLTQVFQGCINNQIAQFSGKILSKYQCNFTQDHSAQHYLTVLFGKWRESVDQGHVFGFLLTGL